MRKTFGLLLIAVMALTMTNCGGAKSSDPKVVATKFTEAFLVKFDPEEMVKYCADEKAEEVRKMFQTTSESNGDGLNQLGDALGALILAHLKELDVKYALNDEQTVVEEEDATVVFDLTSGKKPDFRQQFQVELEKNDKGEWKAADWEMDGI